MTRVTVKMLLNNKELMREKLKRVGKNKNSRRSSGRDAFSIL